MKRIFILLILSLTIQYSFGQACGIYRIKYVGKINSESIKIEKIKLQKDTHISFLETIEIENISTREINKFIKSLYIFIISGHTTFI